MTIMVILKMATMPTTTVAMEQQSLQYTSVSASDAAAAAAT